MRLVYTSHFRPGFRKAYSALEPEEVERILRNQTWIIREATKYGRNLTPSWSLEGGE